MASVQDSTEMLHETDAFSFCSGSGICAFNYTQKGSGHTKSGKECQDFSLASGIGGAKSHDALICVSDGHGHSLHDLSEFGAYFACEAASETLRKHIRKISGQGLKKLIAGRLLQREIVAGWRNKVFSYHKMRFDCEPDYSRYGATLLFCLAAGKHILFGQLGDGCAAIFGSDGTSRFLTEQGSKIGASTDSICAGDAEVKFRIEALDRKGFDCAVIATDGVFDRYDNAEDFFETAKIFSSMIGAASPEEVRQATAKYLIDIAEATDDDLSIAALKIKAKIKARV